MGERGQIGTLSASALVVANMIGAGVFTTSGFALADLHTPERVMLAWLCGGILAMAGALSYGALARQIPESGGEYAFLARTVHPLAGFLAGWVSLLGGFTAPIAAAGLALQAYWSDAVGSSVHLNWIGTAAIAMACIAHFRLEHGTRLQDAAVALKVFLLVAFAIYGSFFVWQQPEVHAAAGPTAPFELTTFAGSLVWITFAYSGWNAAVYIGGLVRNPREALPRALVVGTVSVTAIYLAVNAVFLYAVPYAEIAGRAEVASIAAAAIGGPRLATAVTLVVTLALLTSVSSMVMAGPRVYARMAEDGVFPAWLGQGTSVPSRAVLFQGAASIVVLWNAHLVEVLSYIGFLLGLSAAATVAALISLRLRRGADEVPIPGYPWIPAAFVAATLAISGLMAVRDPQAAAIAVASAVAGIPIYLWQSNRHVVVSPIVCCSHIENRRIV